MIMHSQQPAVTFDAASEPSTDGEDDAHGHNYTRKSGCKKNGQKDKVKSSLCRNYSEFGSCPYGNKCQFAHGLEELRCKVDENSYKTKPCNPFKRKGYCLFGFRCNFSHSSEEHSCERETESLKSFRDIIYEGKTAQGSRLGKILQWALLNILISFIFVQTTLLHFIWPFYFSIFTTLALSSQNNHFPKQYRPD